MRLILIALSLSVLAAACSRERSFDDPISTSELSYPILPDEPYNYAEINLPAHFGSISVTEADNTPDYNPVTNAGATLGRVLFYDKNLSANRSVSCASCHLQSHAFADPAVKSEGFNGQHTSRNSMGLANARFYERGKFFWDERAADLETQVLLPIQDEIEMGLTLDELIERLNNLEYYPPLFLDAFGDENISPENISLALSQFIRSMVSYDSKFDQALIANGTAFIPVGPLPGFTLSENRGKDIFFGFNQGRCASCHTGVLQIASEPRNNGLDESYEDVGLYNVTGDPMDIGKFKVPSLRNIELTGPYMHDGRFETLEEVVEHYNSGLQSHPNLDAFLLVAGTLDPEVLHLTPQDKQDLVNFLKTLTDHTFVGDPKFSDPFVQ